MPDIAGPVGTFQSDLLLKLACIIRIEKITLDSH